MRTLVPLTSWKDSIASGSCRRFKNSSMKTRPCTPSGLQRAEAGGQGPPLHPGTPAPRCPTWASRWLSVSDKNATARKTEKRRIRSLRPLPRTIPYTQQICARDGEGPVSGLGAAPRRSSPNIIGVLGFRMSPVRALESGRQNSTTYHLARHALTKTQSSPCEHLQSAPIELQIGEIAQPAAARHVA